MPSILMRGFLGFIAGAIAVLTFHQGMIALLHALTPEWVPFYPYRTLPVPPFGIPAVVSNCFWGGLWGAAFGMLMTRFTWPLWLCGIALGCVAAAAGWSSNALNFDRLMRDAADNAACVIGSCFSCRIDDGIIVFCAKHFCSRETCSEFNTANNHAAMMLAPTAESAPA